MATVYFKEAFKHLRLIELVVEKEIYYNGEHDKSYLETLVDCLLQRGYTKVFEEIKANRGVELSNKREQIKNQACKELVELRKSINFSTLRMEASLDNGISSKVARYKLDVREKIANGTAVTEEKIKGIELRTLKKPVNSDVFSPVSDLQLRRVWKLLEANGAKGTAEDFVRFIRLKEPDKPIIFQNRKQVGALFCALKLHVDNVVPWRAFCSFSKVKFDLENPKKLTDGSLGNVHRDICAQIENDVKDDAVLLVKEITSTLHSK